MLHSVCGFCNLKNVFANLIFLISFLRFSLDLAVSLVGVPF